MLNSLCLMHMPCTESAQVSLYDCQRIIPVQNLLVYQCVIVNTQVMYNICTFTIVFCHMHLIPEDF